MKMNDDIKKWHDERKEEIEKCFKKGFIDYFGMFIGLILYYTISVFALFFIILAFLFIISLLLLPVAALVALIMVIV